MFQLVLAGLALVALVLYWLGNRRWTSATRALHERLDAARSPQAAARYSPDVLAELPGPVQRYFRTVLTEGQPLVQAVRMHHDGRFNMSGDQENWTRFSSVQRVVIHRPGFVWDARISVPAAAIHVHDAYVGGEGLLRAAVFGLMPVAETQGTQELARDELLRFLAEAAWYPTALLPGNGVRWQAEDEQSATVMLEDGRASATLRIRFDDAGLIASVQADARGRTVGGTVVPTPWEGRWSDYETRDGMRIPIKGEVAWLLPAGRLPYWRGRIKRIEYEWAGRLDARPGAPCA